MFKEIKGRHWVFIIGFICSMITGFYNTEVAVTILGLLFCIGVGIAFFKY